MQLPDTPALSAKRPGSDGFGSKIVTIQQVCAATRKYIEAGKDLEGKGFDPRKLLAPGFDAIKETVKTKMELFGSVGKAD